MMRVIHSCANRRGFTMIEIIMVLIIMAIVGTVVLSRATITGNDLVAQAEILKSHLRFAQIKAMNIPAAGSSYVLYKNNAQATSLLPGESAQTHTLPAGITVTAGVGSTYNFDDWGSPGTSTFTITLSQGTTTSNITITKNTGYIP
jgi:prepilin-type N-terminal cleavage/methylation domain-containing protein